MIFHWRGTKYCIRVMDFGCTIGCAWERDGKRGVVFYQRLPFSISRKWWRYEWRKITGRV